MMWNWFNGGWGFGGWWFMPVIMIVVLGLIIWGIVMLFRRVGWAGGGGCCGNSTVTTYSALEILKRRYASGEISKEEFEEKKKDLI
jgi:putative membrane protein